MDLKPLNFTMLMPINLGTGNIMCGPRVAGEDMMMMPGTTAGVLRVILKMPSGFSQGNSNMRKDEERDDCPVSG